MHAGLVIFQLTRFVVSMVSGTLLLAKWMKSTKRYLSDFPFILSLVFYTLGCAKLVDFYIGIHFSRDAIDGAFISWITARYVLMAINITQMLVLVLIIWFRSRHVMQSLLFLFYVGSWVALFLTVSDYETLTRVSSYLMVPVIASVVLTFIFIHHQKRLGNKFNALIIIYGTLLYAGSQVARPFLLIVGTDEWGHLWLAELLELVAWLLIFYAFFKPTKITKQTSLISREDGYMT